MGFEFSSDLPGVTTPEQYAGQLIVHPEGAGRPLITAGGDVEAPWAPGAAWTANRNPAESREQGHCLVSDFLPPAVLAELLAEVTSDDCIFWKPRPPPIPTQTQSSM